MCAIVDANVASEVFGEDPPPAAAEFLEWLSDGRGVLVVGGRLYDELDGHSPDFRLWASQAILARQIRIVNENEVNDREQQIRSTGTHRSDDPHVLALAQVSGARLLYSNDRNLQQDFGDPRLISQPRGKIYSTLVHKDFDRSHKSLLSRRDLCSS